jgi:hypothetical protein
MFEGENFIVRPNADSIDVCCENLCRSDVVIFIIDKYYGNLLNGKDISAVHVEFDEAQKKSKKFFVFVHDKTIDDYDSHFKKTSKKLNKTNKKINKKTPYYEPKDDKKRQQMTSFLKETLSLNGKSNTRWRDSFKDIDELKEKVIKRLNDYFPEKKNNDKLIKKYEDDFKKAVDAAREKYKAGGNPIAIIQNDLNEINKEYLQSAHLDKNKDETYVRYLIFSSFLAINAHVDDQTIQTAQDQLRECLVIMKENKKFFDDWDFAKVNYYDAATYRQLRHGGIAMENIEKFISDNKNKIQRQSELLLHKNLVILYSDDNRDTNDLTKFNKSSYEILNLYKNGNIDTFNRFDAIRRVFEGFVKNGQIKECTELFDKLKGLFKLAKPKLLKVYECSYYKDLYYYHCLTKMEKEKKEYLIKALTMCKEYSLNGQRESLLGLMNRFDDALPEGSQSLLD